MADVIGGHAEPVIGRAFARPVGFAHPTIPRAWRVLRTNRLDIIPVRVDQKRRVVGRAVIRARAGAAIVAATGLQAFGVEFLDRGMIPGAEGDMGAGLRGALVQMQPERRRALRPKARAGIVLRAERITERGKGRGIEANTGVEIANAKSDVVVHDGLQSKCARTRGTGATLVS